MTKEEFEKREAINISLSKEFYEIVGPIRELDDARMLVVPIAYVVLKNLEDGADITSPEAFVESLDICDEREKVRKLAFYKGRLERVWKGITETSDRIKAFSDDKNKTVANLKSLILSYGFTQSVREKASMPESIAELAIRILDLEAGDRVCEYCTGLGVFTVLASQKEPQAAYTGIDIDSFLCEIASIRVEAAGGRINMIEGDVRDIKPETKFTKAFINYPFGQRKASIPIDGSFKGSLIETVSKTPIRFTDWQYIASALDGLEEGGKAVVVTNSGSLNNWYDREARKIFIDGGYVDTVISLPERLFRNMRIPVTLLVLTKRTSADEMPQTIRMIEASGCCEYFRFINLITDEYVEQIIQALTEDNGLGRNVPVEEIKGNEYVLAADRYPVEKVTLSNSREFGDFIKNIKRGTPMRAEELKSIETDDSGCEYLAIGNVVDGYIDHDSTKHIKPDEALAAKLAKYRINDGDLIISKGGSAFKIAAADVPKGDSSSKVAVADVPKGGNAFKIAVADVPEGTQIIASGNLYVIEIDKSKGVPYFFKAFFESEKGSKLLCDAAVGSTISMISADAIKKLPVPDYPLYEQQRIANEMREVTEEMRERTSVHKRKMKTLRDKAKNICEEWNADSIE